MRNIEVTELTEQVLTRASEIAIKYGNKYLTPEYLLSALLEVDKFVEVFEAFDGDVDDLNEFLEDIFEKAEKGKNITIETLVESSDYKKVISRATELALANGLDSVMCNHIILSLLELEDCNISCYIESICEDPSDLLTVFAHTKIGDEQEVNKINHFSDMKGSLYVNGQKFDMDEMEGQIPGNDIFGMLMGGLFGMPPITSPKQQNSNKQEKRELKYLNKYGTCLNEKEFKPVIGRDKEIALTCRTLTRKEKNNPIHVGEPGVGKTAVVHGLVQAIKNRTVPIQLQDSIIYEISLGSLVAGTKYRGEFEERLKGIINDAISDSNIILYIDEIHQLIGSGATGTGSMDGAQILKPYLNDGSIKCIGATTYSEYKKYIESDAALQRRFKKIDIKEPTIDEAILILQGLKETYEKHHNVIYNDEAIVSAVNISKKFLTEKFLPDKAIDLMDEAGAFINQTNAKSRTVTKELIQKLLAESCNIPSAKVDKDEKKVLKNLNTEMKKVVFGQDEAIDALVDSILISRAGLSNDNKPMGTYLFVGPTGTGKTEVAKQLAEKMGLDFIRYDMSEYMEKHTASKLIGAPAGYVGYEEGGLLTEDIRKHPYCVLLLDEFEKANQDIYNIFLQVMDNAKLTDNQGRMADFRNVIIIMTSNAGASQLGQNTLGFNSVSKDASVITESVNKTFTPEFRNRLSGTIVFNSMSNEMAKLIAKRQLDLFKQMLKSKGITLKVSKNVIPTITKKVLKPEFGGREIIRIVEKEIKPLFSKPIVFEEIKKGDTCTLEVKNDTFIVKY